MSRPVTAGSLAELAVESGLISSQMLHALTVRFPVQVESNQKFGDLLIGEKLLTPWQVSRLAAGRHRGFFLGPYRLESHLARGGMSNLYVAEHLSNHKKRALKVLSPIKARTASYLPRFIREARLASQFRHRNIVRVFDLMKVSDGRSDIHLMVMELLEGCDLFQKVSLNGPVSIREAAELIRQASVGLGHSHRRGLVHRDVKPGNLFLAKTGTVKVVDLGLATLIENDDESLTRDCNERVIGTADYLAPEQAIDSHRADSRADIYALGCTFYFLLTGRPPFHEGSLAQRILSHQSKQPQDIRELRRDLPEELAELLTSMMVKRRARRIQTCAEVARRLEAWLSTQADDDPHDHSCRQRAVAVNDDKRLVGRKLHKVVPVKQRTLRETPTDAIHASETQAGEGNPLETLE